MLGLVLSLAVACSPAGDDGSGSAQTARDVERERVGAATPATLPCERAVGPRTAEAEPRPEADGLAVGAVLLLVSTPVRRSHLATYRLPDEGGRRTTVYAVKAGVRVGRGAPVRMEVTGTSGPARLAYRQELFPRLSEGAIGLDDLPRAVTFEGCRSVGGEPLASGYPGGIIVAQPGCVLIETRSREGGAAQRRLALGVDSC